MCYCLKLACLMILSFPFFYIQEALKEVILFLFLCINFL